MNRRGENPSGRGGGQLFDLLSRTHRTLILGVLASVGGIGGFITAVTQGAGIVEILGALAVGVMGLLLATGYIVGYARRNPGREPRRSR
ncbi:hypothetical protein [Streptomyces sp. MUM 178J]|uniref:hypothetical protein n=1 Tax=Streptomyces sp. MUM 178J TaxID=2791991 RepID=UPI001F0350FD|nr:hypothetical protein [Streptomyces sp. MUM 178J]WRQ82777.1 hypothetical protein I3F59_027425 [Streptomyces sp. MUM 178J]